MRPRRLRLLATVIGLAGIAGALVVAGCAPGSPAPESSSPTGSAGLASPVSGLPVSGLPTSGPPAQQPSPSAAVTSRRSGTNVLVGSDDNFCSVISAQWGDLSGRSVTLDIGAVAGSGTAGSPVAAMQRSLADFVACTGITVTVTRDSTLDQHLRSDALDGSAPDLAVVDGPSLLTALAETGTLAPAPPLVQADLDKLWDPGWRSAGTVNGVLYASPLDGSAAELVWYSPKRFAAWGYRVPTTWDELVAISERAAEDGRGWCLDADLGPALGGWLSAMVLLQAGTQTYDAWASGAVPFADPAVSDALRAVGTLLGLPAASPAAPAAPKSRVLGAVADPSDVASGRCGMVLAGEEWSAGGAEGASIGPEGDLYAFPLPPIAAGTGTPLQVNGDLLVAFANRPEVQALRYYLSTAHWAGEQYADTGRISANRGLDLAGIADPIARLTVGRWQLRTAVSRFDAVPLMPSAVRAAVAKQLGDWATGATTTAKALAAIDTARPAS